MNKFLLLVFLLLLLILRVTGQVQLQTTLPSVGLVQKNQLWNLAIINTSGAILNGRIEMVLIDRQTTQELMTATTAAFDLQRGAVIVNVNKLNPINYNYIGTQPDAAINSLLPVGNYTVCYNFVQFATTDKRQTLVEECVSFDTEPLSPPFLLFPVDSAILDAVPTQFSWTPPTPAGMVNRLHYEVLITEVQPSQKANEAVQENLPFFANHREVNNFMTYPVAYPAFEKDKWYAWQVIARNDNNYASKTETWVFKIAKQNSSATPVVATPYIQLKKNGAEKTIAANGILRFSYFNQLADTTVALTVTDLSEKREDAIIKTMLPVTRGENYLQKDMLKLIKAQEGHLYMLEVENSSNEKWYIQFEVKKYKD